VSPTEMPIVYSIIVFVAMAVLDFVFAEYTKATADRKILTASNWAAMIIPLNVVVVSGYVTVWWMLFPAAASPWLGTLLSIKYGK
jgi:hypothetical protein